MKFYKEVSSNYIEHLFKLLDEEKAEMLQDKNASDSQKAINEYFYRRILNQINNILIDTTIKKQNQIYIGIEAQNTKMIQQAKTKN